MQNKPPHHIFTPMSVTYYLTHANDIIPVDALCNKAHDVSHQPIIKTTPCRKKDLNGICFPKRVQWSVGYVVAQHSYVSSSHVSGLFYYIIFLFIIDYFI